MASGSWTVSPAHVLFIFDVYRMISTFKLIWRQFEYIYSGKTKEFGELNIKIAPVTTIWDSVKKKKKMLPTGIDLLFFYLWKFITHESGLSVVVVLKIRFISVFLPLILNSF